MYKELKFYAYIMASDSKTLYIGTTNYLARRVREHKENLIEGFTQKYSCHKLIYYEIYPNPGLAIAREKQLKNWRRDKKEFLINKLNPSWKDLYLDL